MKNLLFRIFLLIVLILNQSIVFAADKAGVEKIFDEIYQAWNEHDADKLFDFYSKTFMTGDGISKADYRQLTEDLWAAYPDIQIENQKRTIRSQDQYATISGIDFFYGESKDENEEIGKKGMLNAISQGQIFLQKYGKHWKIESDRIHFELVTVYYGNAKQYLDEHQVYFSSPEQVKASDQYSGTLYFILPENVKASASITKELIEKPGAASPEDSFQVVNEHKLERLFAANSSNHNELVSATIILSKGIIEPKLDGILYISKRVNVMPEINLSEPDSVVKNAFAKEVVETSEDSEDEDDILGIDIESFTDKKIEDD